MAAHASAQTGPITQWTLDRPPVSPPITRCPVSDWDENIVPGFNAEKEKSYARDQGELGLCRQFAGADKICSDLKRLNLWPDDPAYGAGCSAIDISVQVFKQITSTHRRIPSTIDKFLEDRNNFPEDSPVAFADFLRRNEGVCPETLFPSEVYDGPSPLNNPDATPRSNIRHVYLAVAARFKEIKKRNNSDLDVLQECPECRLIAPTLRDEEWNEVKSVIASTDLDTGDFLVLDRINQLACRGKRVRLPVSYQLGSITGAGYVQVLDTIKEALTHKETIFVGFDAATLDSELLNSHPKPEDRQHAALIIGALENPLGLGRGGQKIQGRGCYFVFKNSWGPTACIRKAPAKSNNNSSVLCIPESGEFMVHEDTLRQMLKGGAEPVGTETKKDNQ